MQSLIGLENNVNRGGGNVVVTIRLCHASGCGAEVSLSNHRSPIQILLYPTYLDYMAPH